MATNLELQMELNKLLEDGIDSLEKQNSLLKTQATIVADVVKGMRAVADSATSDNLDNMAKSFEKIAEQKNEIDEIEEIFKGLADNIESSGTETEQLTHKMSQVKEETLGIKEYALLAASGFISGFSMMTHAVGGTIGILGTLMNSIKNVGIAIITAPFKILSGLINMSDGGGSNELQQQLEDIRKEFGYLNQTAGGAIVSLSRSMSGQLAETGLSVYRVFGNLAERLKFVAEYAKALGPVFDSMATKLGVGGVEALGAYNLGLGLTAEAQRAVATRAMASGETINEVNRQIANYSLQLSSAFGVTMKEVSRAVGDMMADHEHFGHMAPRELTQVAVYARKLGIEVKALAGIMDRTLNFEDAATQAAQLSQAFGMNIDAMAMMREQDPGRQLEMMRKAFFATGRSVENMSRQERRLLAQQTGLDDASLSLAFSLKNQGTSYDQIARKGEAAKKKQLSQAEAMEKLAGAIERMTQSGGGASGGFLSRFLSGFETGIKRSREFREMMRNIQRALRETYRIGIQVGQAFVRLFPGVKDVFKGIAGLFERGRFSRMLNGVKNALTGFFDDIKNGNQNAIKKAGSRLKEVFLGWFNANSGAGKRLLDGAKGFFLALARIANQVLRVAMEKVTEGIRFVIDFIKNPRGIGISDGGFFGQMFASLTRDLWPVLKSLGETLWELIKLLFEKLKEKATQNAGPLLKIFGALFAPSVVGMVAKPLFTGIASAFSNLFFEALKAKFLNSSAQRAAGAIINSPLQGVTQGAAKAGENAGGVAAGTLKGANQAGDALNRGNLKGDLVRKAATAALVIGAMILLFYAIKDLLLFIKENRISPLDAITAGIAFTATGVVLVAAATTAAILQKALGSSPNYGGLITGLIAVSALAVLMTYHAYKTVEAFKEFKKEDVDKAVSAMKGISVLYLAATAVLLGSTLVGTIITASSGLAVLAIAAGLATIVATVEVMVSQANSIINGINQLNIGSGFDAKARAFIQITQAVAAFASAFGSIISVGSTSIVSVVQSLFGGGSMEERLRSNMESISNLINVVGENIQNIVTSLIRSLRGIPNANSFATSAGALGGLIGGVANLMNALKPSDALLNESIFDFTSLQDRMRSATQFMDAMRDVTMPMIRVITNMVTSLAQTNLTENQLKSVESIGKIIGSVAQLANSLKGDPALARSGGTNFEASAQAVSLMAGYAARMATTLFGPQVLGALNAFIGGIIVAARMIPTEEVPKIKLVGELLSKVIESITSVTGVLNGAMQNANTNQEAQEAAKGGAPQADMVARNLGNMIGFTTRFLGAIREQLPALIGSIIGIARGMSISPADFRKVRTIIDVLGGIGQITTSVTSLMSGESSATINREAITNKLNQMLGGVEAVGEFIAENSDRLAGVVTVGAGSPVARVATTIRTMVAGVNSITRELATLEPMTVNTSLRRLGQNLGLGADNRFEVKHRNFTINLTVNVKVDAEDMERVLIDRTNSRFARFAEGRGQ